MSSVWIHISFLMMSAQFLVKAEDTMRKGFSIPSESLKCYNGAMTSLATLTKSRRMNQE